MTTKKKRSRSRSLVRARKKAQAEGPLLEQQQQAHDWQPHHHDHRYRTTPPTNPLRTISCFEVFVEQQGLLDASEFASFWNALQRPLPINFRIRSGPDSVATREWHRLVHECRLDAWPIDGIAGAWQLQPNSGEIPAVRGWLARHTKTGPFRDKNSFPCYPWLCCKSKLIMPSWICVRHREVRPSKPWMICTAAVVIFSLILFPLVLSWPMN